MQNVVMRLAPQAQLSGTVHHIADGLPGIFQTLATMRAMVSRYKVDPSIRHAAVNVVYLTPEKDEYAEVQAIFEFVRDHVRYLKDVNGVETLATPDKTLQMLIGDCDDQTVLLASMLESVGYPTRFIVAGYSDTESLEHVYMQVLVRGEWIDCDPTEREPLGYAPPNPLVIYFEKV